MNAETGFPPDKLAALRLGQRLVAETAAGPGRRAFVTVRPSRTAADARARTEGWTAGSTLRSFRVEHWEYEAERIEGCDYEVGAVLVRDAGAADEAELLTLLTAWRLDPDCFAYPWDSDDPR